MNPLASASTFFLVFASTVLGAPHPEKYPPAYSTHVCYTSMMTKKGGLHHTRWHHSSTTCHKTASTTVVTTSTPSTVSTTTSIIVTTVTAPSTTDTATVTTTETDTTTTTTTTDTTITTSTTVGVFTPVQSSLLLASFNPSFAKKKVKRDSLDPDNSIPSPDKHDPAVCGYPGSVDCWRYHGHCVTDTVTSTSTSVAPTRTATSTVITISTFITTPGVQTTTTITDSTTKTETDTTTSTATATQTVSTTVDAATACETNDFANYANFVGGQPVLTSEATGIDFNGFASAPATSAYDCCVQAFLNPQGSYFTYFPDMSVCYTSLINEGTCPNGQTTDPGNTAFLGTGGEPQAVVGNSGCGLIQLAA